MDFQTTRIIYNHCKIVILTLVALLSAVPWNLFAEDSASREYKVKAAFLYNFTLFVEWPTETFPANDSPLTICILGKSPFGDALGSLRGKTVKTRKLAVRQINSVQEMRGCQVLFVSASEKMQLPNILAAVKNLNVLTVSDLDRFAEAGGIINFITLEDKVRFEVNLKAAQQARLKISSQLLKLARDVIE
ncbi:MAG: hypothetical protein A3J94_01770 [Syntrophus sp. RIFOXYC2_FULL_54_9]|nr:MAG: hypothetical protein A2X92_06885 [Syntrophus sp. GWC2_56_31]OHE25670.1 MAG: hypothetical protein A3J94_01770 [Syntrophus sp. RIFOXYC2_FULL_54_9]